MAEDKDKSEPVKDGEFDEDNALHLSGIDVIESTTREDWPGASFDGSEGTKSSKPRAHITCPRCAAFCAADSSTCWNCGFILRN